MKSIYLIIATGILSGAVSAQNVNLFQGTINDQKACELTIDQATDLLGRPSAVEEAPFEELAAIVGPTLYYQDEGIELTFNGPQIDPDEKISAASFYLTEATNESTMSMTPRLFQPFKGKLTPSVNPDMKVDDTETLLKESGFYYETVSPEQSQASIEEATGEPATGPFSWRVQARNGDIWSNYSHKGVTGFLEQVYFTCEG